MFWGVITLIYLFSANNGKNSTVSTVHSFFSEGVSPLFTVYIFRSIPVHSQKLGVKWGFFRSIPVHFFSDYEQDDAFPEYIRSFNRLAYTKVMRKSPIFRSISVHFYRFFSYLRIPVDTRSLYVFCSSGRKIGVCCYST